MTNHNRTAKNNLPKTKAEAGQKIGSNALIYIFNSVPRIFCICAYMYFNARLIFD